MPTCRSSPTPTAAERPTTGCTWMRGRDAATWRSRFWWTPAPPLTAWVAGERRVIDVEKEALLIVSEALATLGDRHAILAFNGEGPGRVEIRQLKQFGEPGATETVRRRIAALEPDGFTRAGAALRHAAVALAAEDTRHRLLLVLSDGRPNDVDAYEGRYGIEDTAMAVGRPGCRECTASA